jgi:hypothetical protein
MKFLSSGSLLRAASLCFLFSIALMPDRALAQGPAEEKVEEKAAETTAATPSQNPEVAEIQRKLDVLAAEVEKLRSGEPDIEVTETRAKGLGLSPSAANVYRKQKGVSLAGYGEMLYENFASRNQSGTAANRGAQMDFLRAVFYAGYRFSDKFLFNSEIEVEHANEIWVEFAYLDYLAHPSFNVRGGLLLMPMGLTNEFHEPNVFLGAKRSETESRLIPSTWRENGFGVLGTAGRLSYRAYVVSGLNAAGFAADGLRGGRQRGSRARTADPAFVGRADVTVFPGAFVGGSIYTGGSAQNQFQIDGRTLEVETTIGEVHGQIQVRGLDLRGLIARANLDDVAELNRARNLTGLASIGRVMQGGYAQIGYNVLSQVREDMAVTPYYRFEKLNTQREVAAGFTSDPVRDGTFHSLGMEFRPINNIVVKADYQWLRNPVSTGLNQFNIALGYSF